VPWFTLEILTHYLDDDPDEVIYRVTREILLSIMTIDHGDQYSMGNIFIRIEGFGFF